LRACGAVVPAALAGGVLFPHTHTVLHTPAAGRRKWSKRAWKRALAFPKSRNEWGFTRSESVRQMNGNSFLLLGNMRGLSDGLGPIVDSERSAAAAAAAARDGRPAIPIGPGQAVPAPPGRGHGSFVGCVRGLGGVHV
jgi:hypothetical protein